MSTATYKFKNTSAVSDKIIRRLIRFACRGWEYDVGWLNSVTIRGSNTRHPRRTSGHAYSCAAELLVTTSNNPDLDSLAKVIVHEVGHCATAHKERCQGQRKSRGNGRSYGGSEPFICRNTSHILQHGIPDAIRQMFDDDCKQKRKASKAPKITAAEKRLVTSERGVLRTQEKLADLAKAKQRAERRLKKYRAELTKAKRAIERKGEQKRLARTKDRAN